MTKETKIGLLVGLAFIILFAIILSEKGAPQRDARSPVFATGSPRPSDTPNLSTPLQDGGRFPVENTLNPIVQPTQLATHSPLTEEPVVSADQIDEDALPPLPEDVVRMFAGTDPNITGQPESVNPPVAASPDTAVAMSSDDVGLPSLTVTPGPSATPRGVFAPLPSSSGMMARTNPPSVSENLVSDRETASPRIDVTPPALDRSATVIPAVATNSGPSVIRATHVVKEGDCVSKIAAEYYGRSTPDRIKLIETANKDVLKQKKGIRVGDKIKVPELAGYEDRFEAVAGFTQPRNSTPVRPSPPRDASVVSEHTAIASNAGSLEPEPVGPFELKDGAPRIPKAVPEPTRSAPGNALVLTSPPAMDGTLVSEVPGNRTEQPQRLSKGRWYEVQSGDTLSGIARRELGSERKFKKIYEMNRDVLANKHSLKPGTKLRLPPAEDPALNGTVTTGRMSPGTEP